MNVYMTISDDGRRGSDTNHILNGGSRINRAITDELGTFSTFMISSVASM